MIEIAGIAHVQLTVNDLQRAMPFYETVLGFLGMRPVVKAPNGLYMIGGRTAVMITRPRTGPGRPVITPGYENNPD